MKLIQISKVLIVFSSNDHSFLLSEVPKKHSQKTSIQHW
jgi:hypothetical protein